MELRHYASNAARVEASCHQAKTVSTRCQASLPTVLDRDPEQVGQCFFLVLDIMAISWTTLIFLFILSSTFIASFAPCINAA
jgi:hypothetical protein